MEMQIEEMAAQQLQHLVVTDRAFYKPAVDTIETKTVVNVLSESLTKWL